MNLLELLYDALREEVGLVVTTNNVERLRAKLYELRRKDDDLAVLSFIISPTNPDAELWIVKKEPTNAEAE